MSELNTFKLNSITDYYVEIESTDQLKSIFELKLPTEKFFILGGGSNLILSPQLKALVIKPNIKGIQITKETDSELYLSVGAGENWHDFVEWSLKHNLFGLENLALIPGTVGAAPIQNIGAYGSEVRNFIDSVYVFNPSTKVFSFLSNKECDFGYRDSIFKSQKGSHFIICAVIFRLLKKENPNCLYKEVTEELKKLNLSISSRNIFDAVVNIRKRKLPDPKIIGNVGSFFKNPIVSQETLSEITKKFPGIIANKFGEKDYKLAAGWMIDQLGFKGKTFGQVSVHNNQALVLINLGHATFQDIECAKKEIQDQVFQSFGVHLEQEPILWY